MDSKVADEGLVSKFYLSPQVKRIVELCGAILLVIIILPVGFLIVLTTVLSGQAPICSDIRLGQEGRAFNCLKFTTTRCNPVAKAGWEPHHKLRHDLRITQIGSFLLATGLDELPQLINILAGQMSLVGPRPVTRDEFTKLSPLEAAAYGSVKPGLLERPIKFGGHS